MTSITAVIGNSSPVCGIVLIDEPLSATGVVDFQPTVTGESPVKVTCGIWYKNRDALRWEIAHCCIFPSVAAVGADLQNYVIGYGAVICIARILR